MAGRGKKTMTQFADKRLTGKEDIKTREKESEAAKKHKKNFV